MGKAQMTRVLQIAAAILIVLLAIGLYRAKSDAARTEAHVRALQREIADREADMRALRAEIAARESPANIEALARQRLGLERGSAAPLPEDAIDERLPASEQQKTRQ